jgi:hypothetical protein
MKLSLELFDVVSYLQEKDVPYLTQGKNVGSGWIELNCPYCGDDPSAHLGVNLKSKRTNCWRCGHKGSILELVKGWEKCSWGDAEGIIKQFRLGVLPVAEPFSPAKKIVQKEFHLPPEAVSQFLDHHWWFLKNKGFDPEEIISRYSLQACWEMGEFKFRIIIPIYQDKLLVNYSGRAVIDGMVPKYKHCHNDQAVIPAKRCLYGIDEVKDKAVVVEGPMDVWRMGPGSVALLGMEWTLHQVCKIVNRGLKEIYVMFDGEPLATRKAHKLAHFLAGFIPMVEVLELDEASPHNMLPESVVILRKELGL